MDSGATTGGQLPKTMTGPQSGVFSSSIGIQQILGGQSSLVLTYLPVADDGCISIRCEGPLSLRGKPTGSEPLRELLGPRAYNQKVLLSLEKVVGAETSGVSWLFQSGEKFKANGGHLIVYAIPAAVHSLIELLQMEVPFRMAASEAEARQLVHQVA